MLTRDEILAMPADQLAEVSARMMGLEITKAKNYVLVKKHGLDFIWEPDIHQGQAREVADWVCDQWGSLVHPRGEKFKASDPKDAIDFALDEVRGTQNYHWAWTPEQLTRAALLAFVDAGGEI